MHRNIRANVHLYFGYTKTCQIFSLRNLPAMIRMETKSCAVQRCAFLYSLMFGLPVVDRKREAIYADFGFDAGLKVLSFRSINRLFFDVIIYILMKMSMSWVLGTLSGGTLLVVEMRLCGGFMLCPFLGGIK